MKVMPGGAAAPPQAPAEAEQSGTAEESGTAASGGMLTGLRTIWSHPVLRAAMTLIMLVNTVGIGLDLAIIVLLRHQHVQSGVIGLVLGAGAVGGLAGAPLVKQLHRLRPGVLLMSVCFVASAVIGLMALPFGPWWVAALTFVAMLGVPSIRVLVDVLVFRQTPDAERGRVIAAVMVLIGLGMPVGVFFTGMLLQYLSASTALLVLARRSHRRRRDIRDPAGTGPGPMAPAGLTANRRERDPAGAGSRSAVCCSAGFRPGALPCT